MFFTMADAVDDGRSSGVVDKKRRLDATYAVVGSEFKDKDWGASKTNKPVWEQEARDENGQRRFHGAFTGGFSAGYHNTVGSEEGWAPSSFVSSRTSKAKRVEQTVDSFMDDEDRSEMFSEGLTATKKFNSFFTTADELASRSKKRVEAEAAGAAGGLATEAGGSAPPALAAHASTSAPIDAGLVAPTHKTIGMYLLKKMGWKRGASAPAKRKDAVTFGPKFSHEEIEERNEELFREGRIDSTDDGDDDDDDDDGYAHVVDIVPKNDHYGLGYNPADAIPEYNEMKALREAMAYAGTGPLGGREKKKVPGSGLGLSVLEDDDDGDIYSQESLDMYDREIGGTQREMKRQKNAYVQYALEKIREEEGKHFQEARSSTAGSGDVLCGFVCEAKAPPRRKAWFKPPEVPEDYVPYHYFTEGLRDTISSQLQSILTPQMRTFMLGETPLPRTPHDSVLNLLSIEDRSKFLGPDPKDKDGSRSKGTGTGRAVDIRLPEAVLNAPTRVIYKGDPQKQRRFELFLDEQRRASKGATSPASAPAAPPPPDGLSLRAWEAEKLEFMSNAIMMKPVEGPLADTFAPSGSSYSATEKVVPVEVQKDAAQDRLDKAVERKMYGKLTRTEVRWNPNALLCKRFNVPRPRQNVPDGLEQRDSASVALTKALPLDMFVSPTQAGMAMKAGNDNEYNSLLDAIDEQKRRILGKEEPVGKAVVKSGGGREKEEEEEESERDGRTAEMKRMKEQEEKEEEKPPIDLFKAIFENSDEDEEEDEEKKEDEDDKNSDNVKKESISVKQVIKEEKVSNIKEKEEDEEEDDVILFGPEMPPVPPPPSFKEDVEEGKEDEDECNAPLPKRSKRDSKYSSSDDDSGSGSSSSSDSDSDRKRHKRHRHKSSHHRHHSHHKHHHSHKRHHHHHHK